MTKTWLIAGCASGVRRSLSEAALVRGNNVVLTARNAQAVRPLALQPMLGAAVRSASHSI